MNGFILRFAILALLAGFSSISFAGFYTTGQQPACYSSAEASCSAAGKPSTCGNGEVTYGSVTGPTVSGTTCSWKRGSDATVGPGLQCGTRSVAVCDSSCPAGQMRSTNGLCVTQQNCTVSGQINDPATGQCVCPAGQSNIGGICQTQETCTAGADKSLIITGANAAAVKSAAIGSYCSGGCSYSVGAAIAVNPSGSNCKIKKDGTYYCAFAGTGTGTQCTASPTPGVTPADPAVPVDTKTTTTNNGDGSTSTSTTNTTVNPDGTVTTTTTTTSTDAGGNSTTSITSTTSSGNGNAGVGTPDDGDEGGEEGESSGSASGDCAVPPPCDGDAVQCAQLAQAWHSMCYIEKYEGEGDFYQSPHQGEPKTRLQSAFDGFKDQISDSPAASAITGFFDQQFSGSCPVYSVNAWVFDITLDQWCDERIPWDLIKGVLIVVATLVAARIALS